MASRFNVRSRAAGAAARLLDRASAALAETEYAGRLDDARARLEARAAGPSTSQTDILGRDLKSLERERKQASIFSEDMCCAFPGYATLRDGGSCLVEVAGFAYRTRPLDRASRSQRLFVSAARQLAGLAKLPDAKAAVLDIDDGAPVLDGELTAEPADKSDAFARLLSLGEEAKLVDDAEYAAEDTLPSPSRQSSQSTVNGGGDNELAQMHIRLKERLRAFFAQKLEGRHVRVEIARADGGAPLARGTLLTGEDGGFKQTISLPAASVAPGDRLIVRVELLPDPHADAPTVEGEHQREDSFTLEVARPRAPHVISDIDDTTKHTQVLAGTRTVMRNVFARDLRDLGVPGMASWYRAMAAEGVGGFHYVSNSPWELSAVVRRFLVEADLPDGQLVLKQYARGSALLSGLWETAGARKRGNVEAVLQAFPDSPFVCVGDSGEMDLEVYTSLAAQYPRQIKAIFIRDVTTPWAHAFEAKDGKPARRPTKRTASDGAEYARQGLAQLNVDLIDDSTDALSPNNPPRPAPDAGMPEQRRKLIEAFYHRVGEAERSLPDGVVLRLFQNGDEAQAEGVELIRELRRAA